MWRVRERMRIFGSFGEFEANLTDGLLLVFGFLEMRIIFSFLIMLEPIY